jgi:pimeloyl-ACP methyl ester carboxylesterase
MTLRTEHWEVAGLDLEVTCGGAGDPLLLLHGFRPIPPEAPFLRRLAERHTIIAPSCPGFGGSPRPDGFATIYDLVHLLRALLARGAGGRVVLAGLSFGGWLAAELAALGVEGLVGLVLVDALGIKVSGPETPDILDVFNTAPEEVRRRSWHDPACAADFAAMGEAERAALARDRAALCLYGWHPYLHNPRLRAWLRRIAVPTLLLWGESDGIVRPSYGRAYAAAIPGARLELIPRAGHHPELEAPEVCAAKIAGFLADGSGG